MTYFTWTMHALVWKGQTKGPGEGLISNIPIAMSYNPYTNTMSKQEPETESGGNDVEGPCMQVNIHQNPSVLTDQRVVTLTNLYSHAIAMSIMMLQKQIVRRQMLSAAL
jgi:hypothetical protein